MEIRELRQLLGEHEFFRGLDPDALDFIAGCGRTVRFASDEVLFHSGDPADQLLIVRAGRVSVEIHAPDRGAIVVDTVGEGDILGASWLFPPYRWQFEARALEPTRALSLDATCLRQKCEEDPALGYELMKRLAGVLRRRMNSARMRLLDLYGDARTA